MRLSTLCVVLAAIAFASPLVAEEPAFIYPLIKGFGGIVVQPDAVEPPRRGAKIIFDITAESEPGEVNRGIESVARYLNLSAQAGQYPDELKLALVLHGGATRSALNDEAYVGATEADANPNLPLLRELRRHGVELLVCGQSLARSKFAKSDVAAELVIAVSAMTVNVNKQLDGYTYLSLH